MTTTETIQQVLTKDKLLAWLQSQPPETTYDYTDGWECVVARYLKAQGLTDLGVYPREVNYRGTKVPIPNDIAQPLLEIPGEGRNDTFAMAIKALTHG